MSSPLYGINKLNYRKQIQNKQTSIHNLNNTWRAKYIYNINPPRRIGHQHYQNYRYITTDNQYINGWLQCPDYMHKLTSLTAISVTQVWPQAVVSPSRSQRSVLSLANATNLLWPSDGNLYTTYSQPSKQVLHADLETYLFAAAYWLPEVVLGILFTQCDER